MMGSEWQATWGVNPRGLQPRLPHHHQADRNNSGPYQGPPAHQTLAKSVASSLVIVYEYEVDAHFTGEETETHEGKYKVTLTSLVIPVSSAPDCRETCVTEPNTLGLS